MNKIDLNFETLTVEKAAYSYFLHEIMILVICDKRFYQILSPDNLGLRLLNRRLIPLEKTLLYSFTPANPDNWRQNHNTFIHHKWTNINHLNIYLILCKIE